VNDTQRQPFLDNLRTLMVLLVLIFHSGAGYGSAVSFWPFHEENPSRTIDLLMLLMDMFMMSILFFIAGYFTLPSLTKHGTRLFLLRKLKRLGLPWLMVTFLLLPILDHIHYFRDAMSRGLPIRGYAEHWFLSMKRFAGFDVGWMTMSGYLDMTQHFYQRYMWFISLLFFFFAAFALLRAGKIKFTGKPGQGGGLDPPSQKSVLASLVLTGFLTILLFGLCKFFLYTDFLDKGWFSLGNIVQFQLGKLMLYICYFSLGIHACSRKWFMNAGPIRGREFGPYWVWGIGCLLLFGINMFFLLKLTGAETAVTGFQLGFVIFYPLWTLSFLGAFISFTARHWNRATRLNRHLAANSYNMYLVHYIFPMTLPLLLSSWAGGPAPVKFVIVSISTIILSYGVSRYLVKPFPRAPIIGLIALSLLLAAAT